MSLAEGTDPSRKSSKPSVRRACSACHTAKTRCSETLPCQNCLKRGIGAQCSYPDAEEQSSSSLKRDQRSASVSAPASASVSAAVAAGTAPNPAFSIAQTTIAPPAYPATTLGSQYYDFTGAYPAVVSAPAPTIAPAAAMQSTFRPAKRPRPLTEEETASIGRNFTRGDFFIGTNAPVRIDPRLPVKLTLGEGDQVHFNIGNYDP
ncbi:Zn(2)-C6 fungal-type domain-containing protein [Mycena chlorophos]|uniref:Zn(2)-C6 fungal-type domain-containing protein n=1 Tax=Mycena chlorophos TaxID=658473 RepID=A0A8H6SP83_MYCCL|nr:Zn(2)-C6 fungal-type domain-containing protein [Mycena chlorophos]